MPAIRVNIWRWLENSGGPLDQHSSVPRGPEFYAEASVVGGRGDVGRPGRFGPVRRVRRRSPAPRSGLCSPGLRAAVHLDGLLRRHQRRLRLRRRQRQRPRAGRPAPNGGLIGATLGYNYQYQRFVLGSKPTSTTRHQQQQTSAGPLTAKSNLNFETTVRARAGYAVDRALFFVTGGLRRRKPAFHRLRHAEQLLQREHQLPDGYAIGAGAEYAFMPNCRARSSTSIRISVRPTISPIRRP